MELEVYQKSDFYEDYISSQKEYYERENADAYFAERLAEKDKEIAHNKYKRCLAMVKYCDASMAYFGEFHDSASEQMVAHYYKWRGRWYELAEKFKEEK